MEKENYKLYNGDCLEVMDKLINEGVKVDFILTDIPYGTTNCKWDNVIPFEPMWDKINKLIKNDPELTNTGINIANILIKAMINKSIIEDYVNKVSSFNKKEFIILCFNNTCFFS